MTSGNFHLLDPNTITVVREERQRRDLTGIDILASSIRQFGLIHPIVVTRDGVLVAGERRLAAVKQLGWTSVSCQYVDELDDITRKLIELEENLKRSDLSWQDESRAIAEVHRLRSKIHIPTEKHPIWTLDDTGEVLSMSRQKVGDHLDVVNEAKIDPSIFQKPKFSTARTVTSNNEARRDEESLQQIRKANSIPSTKEAPKSILNTDFTKWIESYTGPKFNFIHCDFPYGINADKMQQGGSVATHGAYSDSEETYWALLMALCTGLDRVATESAHIMFWFSMHYYHDTMEFFAAHSDFILDPFPLVWLKSDNIGLLPDPQRGPRRIYETALFGARGDRKIVSSVSNAYAAPTDRSIHMSAKPEPVLRHFFRMFCDSTTLILDPTCGSGTSLRAAESLGARHVLGLEINPDFAGRAQLDLDKARRLRNASTKPRTSEQTGSGVGEAAKTEPAADNDSRSNALLMGRSGPASTFEGPA